MLLNSGHPIIGPLNIAHVAIENVALPQLIQIIHVQIICLAANFAFMQSTTDWPMIPTLIVLMNGMISEIGNILMSAIVMVRPNGKP